MNVIYDLSLPGASGWAVSFSFISLGSCSSLSLVPLMSSPVESLLRDAPESPMEYSGECIVSREATAVAAVEPRDYTILKSQSSDKREVKCGALQYERLQGVEPVSSELAVKLFGECIVEIALKSKCDALERQKPDYYNIALKSNERQLMKARVEGEEIVEKKTEVKAGLSGKGFVPMRSAGKEEARSSVVQEGPEGAEEGVVKCEHGHAWYCGHCGCVE